MANRRDAEVDPYSPPSREAEEPLADGDPDSEADDAVAASPGPLESNDLRLPSW